MPTHNRAARAAAISILVAAAFAGEAMGAKETLALVDAGLLPRLYGGKVPRDVANCPDVERGQLAMFLAFRADMASRGQRLPTTGSKGAPRFALPVSNPPAAWPKAEQGDFTAFSQALVAALGSLDAGTRIDSALPNFGNLRVRLDRAKKVDPSVWSSVTQDTVDFAQPRGSAIELQWMAILKNGNYSSKEALLSAATLIGDDDVYALVVEYGLDPIRSLYFSKWTLMDLHAKDIAAALALQNAPRQDAPAIDRDKTTTTAPAPKAFEEALSAYAAIATDVFRYNQAVAAWHGKTEKLGAPPRLDPLVPQRLSDLARQGSLPNAWSLHAESSACWYAIAEDLLIDSGDKAAPTYRDALEKGMQAERDVIIALGTTYSPAYMPSAHLDREHRLAYYANFSSVFHRQDRNRLCRTKPMQDFFGDNGAGPMSTRVMRTAWPASVLLSRITLSPEEVDSAIVAMHQPGSQSPKIRDSMLTGILGRSLPHPDHAWLARLAREYEGDPLGNTAQILLMKDINGTMGDDEVRGAP